MSVLFIRDKDGNFQPIHLVRGAGAYDLAKAGGYEGTEEEFVAVLNGVTVSETAGHISKTNNPHKVTAKQVGAIPEAYPVSTDLDTELTAGGNKITVSSYNGNTKNTPRSEDKTDYAHGVVITNSHTDGNGNKYGVQLCMPSGDNQMYIRRTNKMGITEWYTIYNSEEMKNHFLPKEGGTLTNGLTIDKDNDWGQYVIESKGGHYRSYEADDKRIRLDVRDTTEVSDRRYIDIFSSDADSRHSHAFRFTQVKDGLSQTAYVLHTENINDFIVSDLEYDGKGGTKTIDIRKSTKMIHVYEKTIGGEPNANSTLVRGEAKAIKYAKNNATTTLSIMTNIVWSNTSVTLPEGCNSSNYKYHLVLVG